jgi:hypothetical protein
MTTQYTFEQPPQTLFAINQHSVERAKNTISLYAGADVMLSIGPDGFYVRGVKIEQDEHEAAKVYESFKQWLVWAQLNKN